MKAVRGWRDSGPRSDQRGQSLSVFVLLVMAAMIATAGLVIDGGQKVEATSRAESAAAGAARAAGNAVAAGTIAGQPNTGRGVAAAKNFLAGAPGVTGSVSVADGAVVVETRASVPTIFLSLIGIGQVSGTGRAASKIVPIEGG